MKKILYVLALCVCLNGMSALAEGDATEAPPADEPAIESVVEEAAEVADDFQEPEGAQEDLASDDAGTETANETPVESVTPTESPVEATEAPSGDALPEDTLPEDTLPEDAEAWIKTGESRVGGALKDVLARLKGGETVYLCAEADKPARVEGAPLKLLSEIKLLPDEDRFKGDGYVVRISGDDPATTEEPALLDVEGFAQLPDTDVADLYLWVAKETSVPENPDAPADPAPAQPALTVTAEGLKPGEWSNEMPFFTLSGIPEDKRWSYAAIIYDERIAVLSDDFYAPEAEGVYTVRLAMLDEIGDIVDASEKYTLMLDCTPPESVLIEPSASRDYALEITATDAMSGVAAVSVDGGETWTAIDDGEPWTYAVEKSAKLKAGMIRVRDAAGNVWTSEEDHALAKRESGGFGGGGGGGGGGTPAKQHAKNEKKNTGDYEVMKMQLPEEPMAQLTIDGEPLELTLALTSAELPEAPVGEEQTFMAQLTRWYEPPQEDAEAPSADQSAALPPDTLMLTAEMDMNLGDRFAYEWRFNGEVYRALANSGIRYVALRVGDDIAAFPTEGFLAGTKYTELKMQGVSTRKFDYVLEMKVDLDPAHISAMSEVDFSQTCELSVRTEVEDMAYVLGSSPQSVMYFCDLYLGPAEMLEQPFGAYVPEGAQGIGAQTH